MPRKPENLNSNKIQKRAPNSNSFDSKRKEILKRKSSLPATPHAENLVLRIAKFVSLSSTRSTRHPRGFVFYGRAVFFFISRHPYSATFALYRHARTHTHCSRASVDRQPQPRLPPWVQKKQLTKKTKQLWMDSKTCNTTRTTGSLKVAQSTLYFG